MEEQSNTQAESQEATTESTGEETQQVDTQSTTQADTTQQDGTVTDSMKIESEPESEISTSEQPSLDDIVEEALAGELSEETQKLIDENGLGKHIDMLVAGNQALQEKNNQEVFSVVGGEDSYAELQEWGKNNLDENQQAAVNAALFSGDLNLAKLAVQGLQAQYVAANGQAPNRVIEGGSTANADNRPFTDVNQYLAETRTTEYKRNPEHRASIEAKRDKSGF